MAKLLKLRRGTTTQHGSFTGAEGEVTVDTDKETLVVHDGSTAGGHPVAAEDMANVSSASIAGRLANDSIATSKIAAGALPTDVTVQSANIVDGTIVNADINASAAIAGTKISPNFGSQNVVTTGNVGIGSGSGTNFPLHVVADGNNTVLRVESTDADAGVGPIIELFRNSGTPADNDNLGRIDFRADDAANNESTFARIGVTALDVTNNTEDAKIDFTAVANDQFNPSFSITGAGVDVTGHATVSQSLTVTGSTALGETLSITGNDPNITFVDSNNNPDFKIFANGGTFNVVDSTNSANRLVINSDGHVDIDGNLDLGAGVDVTGNITVSGTVDGRDVASDGSKLDGIESGATGDQTSAEIKSLLASNNLTSAHLGVDSVTSSELANSAVDTNAIQNDAVTADKLFNCPQNHILGRSGGGTANVETLTATQIRSILNVENGATADQSASEIVSLVNGQSITPNDVSASYVYGTTKIGRDSNDYIQWGDNSQMDVYVNGSNEFRFEADGDFHADGDVYAFSTTVSSDENLKKDITIVSDAVTKVEALKGVTFKWKKNDADSAGVIAQDVEKVLPEVVKTVNDMEGNEFKAVNYAGLTSILIEAAKDLSARIKVLEAK